MSEKSTIRIRKIKLADKGEKIIMAYERSVNNQWDEYHFTSSEQAAPEFYEAFDKLAGHAACLCELPGRYDERFEVYGVNFRYSGEESIMGATMSAKMELEFSNTPLILNTPFKKSGPDNGDDFDNEQYLSEECVKALWELERQARLYIDGKRAQVSLFGEDMQGADVTDDDLNNVLSFTPVETENRQETHVL